MLKAIDLFSGVGGLSLGFREAGYEIVLANEIDSDIANAYQRNHPETNMINEDITKLEIEDTFEKYKDNIDIIIGGPPCQGFSQKGRRKTIHDERNFLFRYFFEVVNYVQPKVFLIENVPNLFTAEDGLFKTEIEQLFMGVGYTLNSTILNSSDFGVPQHRKRAFILGTLGTKSLFLPRGTSDRVTIEEAIGDLAYLDSGEGEEVQDYRKPPKSEYQIKMRGESQKLFNHISTSHSRATIDKLRMIPVGMGKEVLPKELLTKSIFSGTWSRMIGDEQSVTITTRFDTPSSGRFTHPELNRAITVREAARIQSFPDDFIFYGKKSSQMKQVGNAVPPLLSKAIAESILGQLTLIR